MVGQTDNEPTLDEAIEAAKASPHWMIAVWRKDGDGKPIHCFVKPQFFPYDDMDTAAGLLGQNIVKLKAGKPGPEIQPELPRPGQPSIFRNKTVWPPVTDNRREEPDDGPPR